VRYIRTSALIGLGVVMFLASSIHAADLEVGPGKSYSRIEDAYSAAATGSVILVYPQAGGAPYDQVALYMTKRHITIRGVAGAGSRVLLSGQGYNYTGAGSVPRAMFQFNPGSDDSAVENFEIKECRNDSYNGAGFRINQANNIAIRNCHVHHNDMGFMSNGSVSGNTATNQLIENCLVHDNGNVADPGYNHNFYLGGSDVTVRGCNVYSSTTGHNIKSRAHITIVEGCYIHDSNNREFDLVDDTENTAVTGSHAMIRGCVVVKDPACPGNKNVIHFGQDGSSDHNGTLHVLDSIILTPFISPVVDLSSLRARVLFRNSVVVDPTKSTSGQALVSATRNGASTTNSAGSNMWISSGFSTPGDGVFSSVTTGSAGQAPTFLNASAGDYRPGESFAGIVDQAVAVPDNELPASLRGHGLLEFTPDPGSTTRRTLDAQDLGAYDWNPDALDADSDELPDSWEGVFLGNTNLNAEADPDSDGLTNMQEYIAGTHPGNPDSRLLLSINTTGGLVNVSFSASAASGTGYTWKTRYFTLREIEEMGTSPETWDPVAGMSDIVAAGQAVDYSPSGPEQSLFFHLATRLE
jgi:hypothetical protein